MHDSLIKYINSYTSTPLTDSEVELIKNAFVPKKIRKKQYFLQEGQVCKFSAFIVKGAMRQYTVDDKGVEHIVRLLIENWLAVDRESFVMLTPSVYNIDAWEDTDVLIITKPDSMDLFNQIPVLAQWRQSLDEHHAFAAQKRLSASISFSAEKRYSDFTNTYPEFLQRFPQHLIASYLGITKESLSRIRHSAGSRGQAAKK
ncbi:MAG TPA: Crp/Fnr family transcriptional regulator [Chitinophagaceae bacterium]|jgi:CRP-like cAMP-binding protein|nr:Crp/Fnr family transcriptional regulator [Chitinophagaceae bacterium]